MENLVFVHDDIVEQILVRSKVEDLIRFKSVCKSWQSLITNKSFVKSHMIRSYNNDHNDNEIGHRRIIMFRLPSQLSLSMPIDGGYCLGSSNGLVCISTKDAEILVGNPCTREVRRLPKPIDSDMTSISLCGGFGYDPLTDDYKVIIVDNTCFQVLSLKSNVWKVIKQMKYKVFSRFGKLCNAALHWLMDDESYNKVIVSFDLALEEFKEIPQPDYRLGYGWRSSYGLGIMEECLSIYVIMNYILVTYG